MLERAARMSSSSQRPAQPTVRPPFDPEEYARESESRIPTAPPPADPPTHTASAGDVPVLAMSREDLEWFDLPELPRALLPLIDGHADVRSIASRANAELAEVLSALDQLVRDGAVTWRG